LHTFFNYNIFWPYDHKTFELKFVLVLEKTKKLETISDEYFVLIRQFHRPNMKILLESFIAKAGSVLAIPELRFYN